MRNRKFDQTRATREGWGIFNGSTLQRIDEKSKFKSDEEALHFVRTKAAAGSKYHSHALAICKDTYLPPGIYIMQEGGIIQGIYHHNCGALPLGNLKFFVLDFDTDGADADEYVTALAGDKMNGECVEVTSFVREEALMPLPLMCDITQLVKAHLNQPDK